MGSLKFARFLWSLNNAKLLNYLALDRDNVLIILAKLKRLSFSFLLTLNFIIIYFLLEPITWLIVLDIILPTIYLDFYLWVLAISFRKIRSRYLLWILERTVHIMLHMFFLGSFISGGLLILTDELLEVYLVSRLTTELLKTVKNLSFPRI